MSKGLEVVWRFATVALLVLMLFASFGMMLGVATFGSAAGRHVVTRFVAVAAVPVAWAAVVALFRRRGLSPALIFALTAALFVAFVGAIDLANGRPPYDWVGPLLS